MPTLATVSSRDWEALAAAISGRRDKLGLSQGGLLGRGGPSRETVRQLEIGQRDDYHPSTFVKVDRALGWGDGVTRMVLTGVATPEQTINAPVRRDAPAPEASTSTEPPEAQRYEITFNSSDAAPLHVQAASFRAVTDPAGKFPPTHLEFYAVDGSVVAMTPFQEVRAVKAEEPET